MEITTNPKKTFKKDTRRIGWSLVLHTVIAEFIALLTAFLVSLFTHDESASLAIGQFVGTLGALGFMFLFFSRQNVIPQLFKKERSMSLKTFGLLLCVFFAISSFGDLLYQLLCKGLNLCGLQDTSYQIMEMLNMDNWFMRLSVWVLAPIGEELIFRGLLMRKLQKYGKMLALVVPSILFGVMHGNFMQMIPATLVGLALGYVAMEYSVIWSILIHAINNILLATLIPQWIENSNGLQIAYNYVLPALCLVASVILLICRRKQLAAWIRENKWQKPQLRWTIFTFGTLLFLALHFIVAISCIQAV